MKSRDIARTSLLHFSETMREAYDHRTNVDGLRNTPIKTTKELIPPYKLTNFLITAMQEIDWTL